MALSVIDGALEHSFDVLGGAARHFRSGSIRDSHYKGLSHISCPPRAPSSVKIDHNLFTSSLELLGNLPEISPQSLISIFTRGLKRSNGVTGVKFSNFQCQIFPGRSRKKALDWKLHVIAQPMSEPRHPILTKIIIFGPRSKREKSAASRQEKFLTRN